MIKCGKGCMPECEYFTTGGCISPFNCLYKIETGYINSATSTPDSLTDLLIEFDEMGFAPTTVCPNLEQYATEWRERVRKEFTRLTDENDNLAVELEVAQRDVENLTRTIQEANEEIKALESENAELKARLEKAAELPCKVGDTIYEVSSIGIREWLVTSIELLDYGFKANCEGKNDFKLHWHFVKTDYCNDFEGKGRIRVTREAAEARLKELKEEI